MVVSILGILGRNPASITANKSVVDLLARGQFNDILQFSSLNIRSKMCHFQVFESNFLCVPNVILYVPRNAITRINLTERTMIINQNLFFFYRCRHNIILRSRDLICCTLESFSLEGGSKKHGSMMRNSKKISQAIQYLKWIVKMLQKIKTAMNVSCLQKHPSIKNFQELFWLLKLIDAKILKNLAKEV